MGYGGTAYKRGRTVVRLTGLLYNSTFASLTDSAVSSAKFYISDGSGTSASTVILYPLSSSSWTESGVTWNNVSGYSTSYSASASVGGGNFASFDITNLVKAWRRDEYGGGENGFILIGASESSVDRALYSSEHSTTAKLPYVVLSYTTTVTEDFRSDYNSSSNYLRSSCYANSLQYKSNCYGYAFRFYSTESGLGEDNYYGQYPGDFADKTNGLDIGPDPLYTNNDVMVLNQMVINNYDYSDYYRMSILIELMQADANTLDYTITEYTGTDIMPGNIYTNRRLIAVVLGTGGFHYYMQHTDSTWSHKPGSNEPTNICFCGAGQLTNSNIRSHAVCGLFDIAQDSFT